MSDVKVQFLFDFGSPNAYFSHKVIPGIEQRTGTRFEYVPILLGGLFKLTGNRSPVEAFAGIRNKLEYGRIETDRFVRKHGLTAYRFNPNFPVNTLQIMRGAVAAQVEGCFEPYVEAMFAEMWEHEKKLDEPAVIEAALKDAGLDSQRIMRRANDPDVKQALLESTKSAADRGAFGSPTFFVNDEIYFGKDKLAEVEEEIMRIKAL